jgi:glycosyltransferase involved in cell wall biosynthesis
LLINDGSTDNTLAIIKEKEKQNQYKNKLLIDISHLTNR